MPYFKNYINTVEKIIEKYEGKIPLADFLKSFFRQDKKYGSRDRKIITELCFVYYRCGVLMDKKMIEEILSIGFYLTKNRESEFLKFVNPILNETITQPLAKKINEFNLKLPSQINFNLTNGISADDLILKQLIQPNVYFRARNITEKEITERAGQHNFCFEKISSSCYSITQGIDLKKYFALDSEIVIQDVNSQRIVELFPNFSSSQKINIWDCCAGGGGKSILLCDHYSNNNLLTSDNRNWMIKNLLERFANAGIKNYSTLLLDLTKKNKLDTKFDLVVVDAPCSGSGTWGRTPERMSFFNKNELHDLVAVQKKIITNVWKNVKDGGYLVYVTCSVFYEENEAILSEILKQENAVLIKQKLFIQNKHTADILFGVQIQKNHPET